MEASQLQPTTFAHQFVRTYTNALKGLVWSFKSKKYEDNGLGVYTLPITINIGELVLSVPLGEISKQRLLQTLNEAFLRGQSLGKIKLTSNPFHELWKRTKLAPSEQYKSTVNSDGEVQEWWEIEDCKSDSEEKDRRAFTKDERDIIIKGFYESPSEPDRVIAPLIEFLFLTGCRPGEAFALRWGDVKFERGIVRFSKSYNGALKNTQTTKTKEIRMFELYPVLSELLERVKPVNPTATDLVFVQSNGKPFYSQYQSDRWLGGKKSVMARIIIIPV